MDRIEKLDDSRLFRQLVSARADNEIARDSLRAHVRAIVEHAKWISEQINRFLPQYTLHNGTHLFNVLRIMEELLPEETIAHLSPLECALCILAAFTHDLGMALSGEEHHRLFDEKTDSEERRAFLRHRDRFSEEVRQIERLREEDTDSARQRVAYMEGQILADYLRRTHASDTKRVLAWFDKIEATIGDQTLFKYGNVDFKEDLALIGVSHNQDVHWLREQFTRREGRDDAFLIRAGGEEVNLAFPGLLLRLADYMDFDVTRAPDILYRHFGIEDAISVREWQKHMAITGWGIAWNTKPVRLIYEARDCERPILEKTIRDFVRDIEVGVRQVEDELRRQRRDLEGRGNGYILRLPDDIEARVVAERIGGKPAYIYQEMQFRLDQDEILQLLMGENLYGDPSLCIRELLQNSLDALQMRDLRLSLLHDDPDAAVEPTDSLRKGEELRVELTWGKDAASGQEFIRVTDNGSGMTRPVLERFFTQIGKSYYRSPDFAREQALLRGNGKFATPISHFGIGILSCFMIGDRLEVRTCPGRADNEDRAPYDITISGPGSLFWMRPGTRKQQGTEITVYLKADIKLRHEPETLITRLRVSFGYEPQKGDEAVEENHQVYLDPAFIALRHIIWPQYKICIRQDSDTELLTLNDRFHFDYLCPIPTNLLEEIALTWDCPKERLGTVRWANFDWTDNVGVDATGSHIRFIFPQNIRDRTGIDLPLDSEFDDVLCRHSELASFVTALNLGICQDQILVNGIFVDQIHKLRYMPLAKARVGGFIWTDLRGAAAPRLTADRKTALPKRDVGQWETIVSSVFLRWGAVVQDKITATPQSWQNWLTLLDWSDQIRPDAVYLPNLPNLQFHLMNVCFPSWKNESTGENSAFWRVAQFEQSLCHYIDPVLTRESDLTRDPILSRSRPLSLFLTKSLDNNFFSSLSTAYYLALSQHIDVSNNLARDVTLARNWSFDLYLPGKDRAVVNLLLIINSSSRREKEALFSCLRFNFLAEAFQPSLERSYPLLNIYALKGHIEDAALKGPGIVQFTLNSDDHRVTSKGLICEDMQSIEKYEYDLVFPLTCVPIGNLRQENLDWGRNRFMSSLAVLPCFTPIQMDNVWATYSNVLIDYFRVPRLHFLLPRFDLWDKPFSEWRTEDWQTCGLTVHWDITTGRVLWAAGAHTPEEMQQIGQPAAEFFGVKIEDAEVADEE